MSSRLAELGAFIFGVSIISRLVTDTAEGAAQALKGAPPAAQRPRRGWRRRRARSQQRALRERVQAPSCCVPCSQHSVLSSPTSMLRPEGAEHRYLSTNLYLPINQWPDARKGHWEEGSRHTQPAGTKKESLRKRTWSNERWEHSRKENSLMLRGSGKETASFLVSLVLLTSRMPL